jgi:hypothetical protein
MYKHSATFLDRLTALFLGPLAIVGLTLLVAWSGLASASSISSPGKVHFYEVDSSLAGPLGSVILTGAITDHGIDHYGVPGHANFNKLVLSKGSFEINIAAFPSKLASLPVNPKTCSSAGTVTAQAPIVNGTGTGGYRGIRGTFQATVTSAAILPRLKNHACNTHANGSPSVLIARATGFVSYR